MTFDGVRGASDQSCVTILAPSRRPPALWAQLKLSNNLSVKHAENREAVVWCGTFRLWSASPSDRVRAAIKELNIPEAVIAASGKCDSNLFVSRGRVHSIRRINLLVQGRKGTPKMRDELYCKTHDQEQRFQALARKCRLDSADEERAIGVYHSMIDAIAESIEARANRTSAGPPPTVVYIAAYRHRFGVDLSAHASQEEAESRLLEIAWQQCMRDASIRAAVDARFGPLVADQPPLEPPFPADEHQPDVDSWWNPPQEEAQSGENDTVLSSQSEAKSQRACAGDNSSGRRRTFREQLLEEWPQLSRGEQLWIECCTVEREEELISVETDEADDPLPAHAKPIGSFHAASSKELRAVPKQRHT